jgi:cytochrome P450
LLGNGLLTSVGEEWKQNRKLIQPAFHKKKLDEFVKLMQRSTEESIQKLKLENKNVSFDIAPFFNALALDIISKSMFGAQVEKDAIRISEIIIQLNKLAIDRLNNPITTMLFRNNKDIVLVKELDTYIYKIMNERRASGDKKDDLLQMLLDARDEETGEGMSDVQIRDEIMTIFIAGHETTACALSWAVYAIGKNKEVLTKLREEINSFTGEINFDTIFSLQYFKMVVEETLRMYPPAWSMGRRTYAIDTFGNYQVRPDTNILIPIYYMHHHKDYWEKPEEFIPERFHPSTRNNINRFVYLPFGGGARMCIGNHFAMMEMILVLFLFIKNFDFEIPNEFEAELEPLITLHAKNGVQVKLKTI